MENINNLKSITEIINEFPCTKDGYVDFLFVASDILENQTQYVGRYIDDIYGDRPDLSKGLRIIGNSEDYHEILIHKDDIILFVTRVLEDQDKIPFSLSKESKKILEECRNIVGETIK